MAYKENWTPKIGDRCLAARKLESMAGSIDEGTPVIIVGIDHCRGYAVEDMNGRMISECGWHCVKPIPDDNENEVNENSENIIDTLDVLGVMSDVRSRMESDSNSIKTYQKRIENIDRLIAELSDKKSKFNLVLQLQENMKSEGYASFGIALNAFEYFGLDDLKKVLISLLTHQKKTTMSWISEIKKKYQALGTIVNPEG